LPLVHCSKLNNIGRLLKTPRSSYYITIVGGKMRYSSRKGVGRKKSAIIERGLICRAFSRPKSTFEPTTVRRTLQLLHSIYPSPDHRRRQQLDIIIHIHALQCMTMALHPSPRARPEMKRSFMYFYDGSISKFPIRNIIIYYDIL